MPTLSAIVLLVLSTVTPVVAQEPLPPPYVVVDPSFEPLQGAAAFSGTLTIDDADSGYQIEVPEEWNGTLVLYAHGFVGPQQAELIVQPPPLRELFIAQGFAWAASSYSANGYVIDAAVEELDALREQFADLTGLAAPTATIVHGFSMGGHITGVAIERRPDAYAGALPACGAIGDAALFDYFADVNLVAGALSGVEVAVPETLDFLTGRAQTITAVLGLQEGLRPPVGDQYAAIVEELSGGERPTFEESLEFWNVAAAVDPGQGPTIPFLQALWGRALSAGIETPAGQAATYDNTATVYGFPGDPAPGSNPVADVINAAVTRVAGNGGGSVFPEVDGTPQIPVLTLHNTGDLFVPLLNERVYAAEVEANGLSDNLVTRTVRAAGHCDFTAEELGSAFADLVAWIGGGPKPAGEDLLDDAVVASRDLGCDFTSETRQGMPECDEAAAVIVEGDDPVATSLAVSAGWEASDAVLLARDDVYADGLAGSSLAGVLQAPLLLNPSDGLDDGVLAEIERLGAQDVYLLGGTAALSQPVSDALTAAGLTVERLAGPDRFATAAAVAAAVDDLLPGGVTAVLLASGRTFADAVAASGLASFTGQPILLVEPTFMPEATAQALADLGGLLAVVGGDAAVAREVDDSSPRLEGPTRYGTSVAVALASAQAGAQANRPWVATGESFADALVAGPAAAAAGQMLLLVDGDDLAGSGPTTAYLEQVGAVVEDLVVVRSAAAVSDDAVDQLVAAVAGG